MSCKLYKHDERLSKTNVHPDKLEFRSSFEPVIFRRYIFSKLSTTINSLKSLIQINIIIVNAAMPRSRLVSACAYQVYRKLRSVPWYKYYIGIRLPCCINWDWDEQTRVKNSVLQHFFLFLHQNKKYNKPVMQ